MQAPADRPDVAGGVDEQSTDQQRQPHDVSVGTDSGEAGVGAHPETAVCTFGHARDVELGAGRKGSGDVHARERRLRPAVLETEDARPGRDPERAVVAANTPTTSFAFQASIPGPAAEPLEA